ncbi:hypothetical protein J9253_10510 [Thiothrix litoralis]|uniref:Uncharacterized protein n=1 Tax=Thiothrix litoralis TaxID=2891210 RepID=A0ABX7WQ05_9GAMM|nr:hypothetical protein [Thiothrix litoralis]QTR44488.1 hypothetical protein J9253_10510 [Thiothrix litoralis]
MIFYSHAHARIPSPCGQANRKPLYFGKIAKQEVAMHAVKHEYINFDQVARQTPSFRSGRIARVAKPPYVR